MGKRSEEEKQQKCLDKLAYLCDVCSAILVVDIMYLGSSHIQQIRHELRGQAELLMGKNSIVRGALEALHEARPELRLQSLLGALSGKVGLLFLFDPWQSLEVASCLGQLTRPGRAVANHIASDDIWIPRGLHLGEPGSGAGHFISALNIYTKVTDGIVEVTEDKRLVEVNERISPAVEAFLDQLSWEPFTRRMTVLHLWQAGRLVPFSSLPSDEALQSSFLTGLHYVLALRARCD